LKDLFPLPIFEGRSTGRKVPLVRNQIAGVEVHATAAAMLLDGAFIKPPSNATIWWSLFGLCVFSAAWTEIVREHISRISRTLQEKWHKRKRFRRLHFRVQDLIWFTLYGLVSLVPVLVYWNICVYLFIQYDRWIVAAYPMIGAA